MQLTFQSERIALLIHILCELHTSHGITAQKLKDAGRHIQQSISPIERLQLLDELYRVKEEEEKFLDRVTEATRNQNDRPHPPATLATRDIFGIEIEPDKEIAIERAETARSASDIVVYSNASERQGHLGAAATTLNDSTGTADFLQIQVGPMDRWSVHAAELVGILYAINIINKAALQRWRLAGLHTRTATILSDSMSALQAIQNPKIKSAQQIIFAILESAKNTKSNDIAIRLQWMPGHCEEPGNDTADQLAREAAVPGKTYPFAPLLSREKAFIRRGIYAQWEKE
ncbi:uncharacterized protein N7443_001809 [Penicillium atrosanguineum]|uniref:uncharacterized protein n=1 Tax=Penicillium atrosanguineum TaxID=1132637 RepID=UPI002390D2D4|nr:uncharacterized protein N7443_001809 [Penicillium atrosanguineum]KAJ5309348.1 hypothetical protein N7443_001809 [Penicillium atrosanguineum]